MAGATVVGIAEIEVVTNTGDLEAGLRSDTDAAFAGVAADAEVAGGSVGDSLAAGLASNNWTQDAEGKWRDSSGRFVMQAELAGAGMGRKLEEGVTDAGDKAGKGFTERLSQHLSNWGASLQGSGIPGLSSLGKGLNKSSDELGGKAKGLNDQLSKLGGAALLGTGVAFAAVGYEAVKAASGFQQATTSIANTEGISVKAANNIGQAFLGTAGTSKYSATEMANAFASVSGQLKTTQGSALTTKETLTFMAAASDLAEAKQIDLGTATQALGATMQAFQIRAKDASSATDILYNASNATGISVDQLSQQFIKMHSKLGDLGGGLKDFGGLLVALIHDGFSGRAAMTALSGGMTTLLKPNIDLVNAQQAQKVALESLPPKLQTLAHEYANGTITSKEFTKAGYGLNTAQAAIVKQFTTATDAVTKSKEALAAQGITVLNSKGQFVGMGEVIAQLKPKFDKMTEVQQLAYATTLFGASAAKQLTKVIDDGSASYDRATAAVSKQGSAHAAAEVQAKTLATQLQTLKAAADDIFVSFGQFLIPVLTKVGEAFAKASLFVLHHHALLIALGVLIGGFLATAISVFAINKMVAFGQSFVKAGESVGKLVTKLFGLGAASTETGADIEASAEESAAASTAAADEITASATEIQNELDSLGAAYTEASAEAQAAIDEIEASLAGLSGETEAAAAGAEAGFAGIGDAAEVMAADTDAAAVEVDAAIGSTGIGLILIGLGIAITLLLTHWKQVWGAIKDVALAVWHFLDNDVIHPIEKAFEWVVDEIKEHWKPLLEILIGPIGWALLAWQKFGPKVVEFLKHLLHDIADIWDNVRHETAHLVDDVVHFFESLPGRVVAIIKGAGSKVLGAFESWIPGGHAIGGAIGGAAHAIASIFGEGGIVDRPTLAIVGDKGPEAIVPLNRQQTSPFGLDISGTGGRDLTSANHAAESSTSTRGNAPLIGGNVNVYNARMTARELVAELSWAEHTGVLGAMR